ncbi:MAG: DUF4238 domain-containing protein, partial [Flavobacteriales bacterium]|nr:DUF4238 domain-containing protein [Flavobacteriales bacterium]
MNNKTKREHYVPQSYLKGFSAEIEKPFRVFCKIKGGKIVKQNVAKICFENDLYNVPEYGEELEQEIETFYGRHVDANFPSILKFA